MIQAYLIGGMALFILAIVGGGYFYVDHINSQLNTLKIEKASLEGELKASKANHQMALDQVENIAKNDALLRARVRELENSLFDPAAQRKDAVVRVQSPEEFLRVQNKQIECMNLNGLRTDGTCIAGEFRIIGVVPPAKVPAK